jgi:hypothetical protein
MHILCPKLWKKFSTSYSSEYLVEALDVHVFYVPVKFHFIETLLCPKQRINKFGCSKRKNIKH